MAGTRAIETRFAKAYNGSVGNSPMSEVHPYRKLEYMPHYWRGLVRVAVVVALVALLVALLGGARYSAKIARSRHVPPRFTEVRCDTLGILLAEAVATRDNAKALNQAASDSMKIAAKRFDEARAYFERMKLAASFYGGNREELELMQSIVQLAGMSVQQYMREFQSTLDDQMTAITRISELERMGTPGTRSPIERSDPHWRVYLANDAYRDYWNLDLTKSARLIMPPAAAVIAFFAAALLPILCDVSLRAGRGISNWVQGGFASKKDPES